ncbi:uncharacterized protein MYCFIDRAFT_212340 [Pseudocercospora fijiensis CIRAD86]|uniref:Uncharacterized protein n=1 Tax=Pseudocercospora fijiensis (strain CIRAD86) TaxID=383855 RepID=M3AMC8_PSEFD|nr:uncharacterized protein MYCFIDRAFT_212340 [Pseudocercospora fijiensis CIRAD86]EME78258.1 hypothetical protein MYCFIDRAFT_212340 [Pseudocercospora fijiensis CIRAD86]
MFFNHHPPPTRSIKPHPRRKMHIMHLVVLVSNPTPRSRSRHGSNFRRRRRRKRQQRKRMQTILRAQSSGEIHSLSTSSTIARVSCDDSGAGIAREIASVRSENIFGSSDE